MVRSLLTKKAILATLAVGALSACGVDPYGVQYDQYGNPISGYGTTGAYGSTYGSSYSGTSSSYGSTSSTYDSSYSSSTYGSTSSSYDSSYGSSYGSTYGSASPVPSTGPTLPPVVIATEASVLNAYVKDVKKNGLLGLGGLTARVEVTNPTNRTLSGRLSVTFTAGGHESGNMQARKITLRPLESQVLTFTANGITLNGAEASISTDTVTSSQSSVADRIP
ncbi:MAG: hypothetical protein JWM80_4369 [Cyanobacteria bacterium RYN_339]|nr:hypothetical protein [Cyanobacteria bacterium RYN_339]